MRTPATNSTLGHLPTARPGFSLIELVMVMTIISILAAIAVPRYASALSRYRADAAARRIVTDLAYARELARTSSASVAVEVLKVSETLNILGAASIDQPGQGYQTVLSREPYFADVFSADFGTDHKVVFNGYGDADTGGTVVVRVGPESRTVVLNADTGKAGVQ